MDDVIWIPVLDIIKYTTESCDYGSISDFDSREDFWDEIMLSCCSDTGFGYLIESIQNLGFLEGGAVGWQQKPEDNYKITEGHHRICAAILLCLEEIPTTQYGLNLKNPDGLRLISAHSVHDKPSYPIEF